MRKIAILTAFLLLGIGLLIWVFRVVGWEEIREAIITFSGPGGFIILVLSAGALLVGAWRWQYILQSRGYKVTFRDIWRLYISYFAISFFAPHLIIGGEAFRTYVISEKYSIPWGKCAASVVIERVLELTWNLLVILVGVGFFLWAIGFPPRNIAFIFGGAVLFLAALVVFFYFRSFRKESIIKIFLKKVDRKNHMVEIEREVFSFFRPQNLFMWQAFAITVLRGAFNLARVWVLILFLGKAVGPFQALSALGFFYLSLLVPIPAALGTHDALQAFSFGAMGLGRGTGAVFTMILRGADLLLALAGIVLLFRLGLDLFQIALFKKAERVFRRQ